MWCGSVFGWFSIIRIGQPGEWQIRARLRSDLVNLIAAAKLGGQKVIETSDATIDIGSSSTAGSRQHQCSQNQLVACVPGC
jgi:hypothetical protein